jgi:C4-type Zn-finger protein
MLMRMAVEEQNKAKKVCPMCGAKLKKEGARAGSTPRRKIETWACSNKESCSYKTEEVFDGSGRKLFQG